MEVGEVYETNYWGAAEVVELLGGRNIVVRFINTGNVRRTRADYLLQGNVKDSEAETAGVKPIGEKPKARGPSTVGTRFSTNYYGDVEVVKYRNSKEISVRFLATGNLRWVQRRPLELGQIQDIDLKTKVLADKEAVAEGERDARDAMLIANRRSAAERKLRAEVARDEARLEAARRRANAKAEMYADMVSKDYKNNLGDAFKIVCRGALKGTVVVEFVSSGNKYEVLTNTATRGAVQDLLDPTQADRYKALARSRAAVWYEDNREHRIACASAYQRDNLDRTRERNRRSASRRVRASGRHTKADLNSLLLLQGGKCKCCGYDLSEGKHLDHIMPLVLGGENNVENLQWLCQVCNSIKADRHPDEWAVYSASDEYAARLSTRRKLK